MKEIRCFISKDKETKYINKKCSKGYALSKVGLVAGELIPLSVYTFEKCEPDEFEYKICMMTGKDDDAIYAYAEQIKPTGAKLIALREKCAYFRNKGKFIIPLEGTDSANKAKYYRLRAKKSFMTAGFCFIFLLVNGGLLLSGVSGSPVIAIITAGLAGFVGVIHEIIALGSKKNAKANEITE